MHDLLKTVGNYVSNVQIALVTYIGIDSLDLPVLALSSWLVSISDEGSLPEIALSSASILAS